MRAATWSPYLANADSWRVRNGSKTAVFCSKEPLALCGRYCCWLLPGSCRLILPPPQLSSESLHPRFEPAGKAAEADRQKRLFRSLFAAAVALLVAMVVANMGLTAAVVFMAKDTSVASDGALVATSTGELVRVQCVGLPPPPASPP